MKRRTRLIVLYWGFGMGLTILILGMLTGITMIKSPGANLSAREPTLTPSSFPLASSTPILAGSMPTDIPETSVPPTPALTPTPTPVITTHTVETGDTLYSIAFEYNAKPEEIVTANSSLTSTDSILYLGQVLTIPDSAPITPVAPNPSDSTENIVYHNVVSGETLSEIALYYDIEVQAIKLANNLRSNLIKAKDELKIPLEGTAVQQPTPESMDLDWQPSIIRGNLDAFYTQVTDLERFNLHYQPNSLPAQNLETVSYMVKTALGHIERTLDVHLNDKFDVYVAGSLFRPPNLALRGRSFSSQRRFFFLYDGSGTPADQQYILTHELTHVTTWNTMRRPVSVMLHEGVAVYTGMELVEGSGYIPLDLFCAAYHSVGRLPSVSSSPGFKGHIRDLENYYAAGSFVQFLIEEYGTASFATVYHTGDYHAVYGKSIKDLEAEWVTSLEDADYSIPFDPNDLVYYVNKVAVAYDYLFESFVGTENQFAAYHNLDRARIALLQGRLEETASYLSKFESILR